MFNFQYNKYLHVTFCENAWHKTEDPCAQYSILANSFRGVHDVQNRELHIVRPGYKLRHNIITATSS